MPVNLNRNDLRHSKMRCLLCFLIAQTIMFQAAGNAYADEGRWVLLHQRQNGDEVFLDMKSVLIGSDLRYVWTKISYAIPSRNERIKEARIRLALNCENQTSGVQSAQYIGEAGGVVDQYSYEISEIEFLPNVPESLSEVISEIVCEL